LHGPRPQAGSAVGRKSPVTSKSGHFQIKSFPNCDVFRTRHVTLSVAALMAILSWCAAWKGFSRRGQGAGRAAGFVNSIRGNTKMWVATLNIITLVLMLAVLIHVAFAARKFDANLNALLDDQGERLRRIERDLDRVRQALD